MSNNIFNLPIKNNINSQVNFPNSNKIFEVENKNMKNNPLDNKMKNKQDVEKNLKTIDFEKSLKKESTDLLFDLKNFTTTNQGKIILKI